MMCALFSNVHGTHQAKAGSSAILLATATRCVFQTEILGLFREACEGANREGASIDVILNHRLSNLSNSNADGETILLDAIKLAIMRVTMFYLLHSSAFFPPPCSVSPAILLVSCTFERWPLPSESLACWLACARAAFVAHEAWQDWIRHG